MESVMTQAGQKIGLARFAVYGKSVYPDATFTLRLGYGSVKGYPMNGTEAPPRTTFYGLYDRSYGFDQKVALSAAGPILRAARQNRSFGSAEFRQYVRYRRRELRFASHRQEWGNRGLTFRRQH